jgi:heme oxygenase (biliverdin-IX-beta and delta-forming)
MVIRPGLFVPASSASPDVLTALRAATAQRHAILDSSTPLAKSQPNLVDYHDHLLLLKAWLGPIESWLSAFTDGPQDAQILAPLQRMPLLESDLAHDTVTALRVSSDAPTPVAFPPASASVSASGSDAAYRWGVCYVVEGSQLGGAVLYKKLHAQLSPHPLRYLAGEGEPVGPRWRGFVQALQQHVTNDAAIRHACVGAMDAFDSLIALLPHTDAATSAIFTGQTDV